MILTNIQNRSKRLQICRACEHYVTLTKSCGTLVLGSTIMEGNEELKLCGCIMTIKAGLKTSSCPLGKWSADINKADLKEIEELVGGIVGNRISGKQNKKLTELWNKAAGRNRKLTNCNSCVREMIKDLKHILNEKQ